MLKASSPGWPVKGEESQKLVMNIEISKDGDLRKRVEGQNVLHFGS
ncbi:hypothetical protein E2C01_015858 [Portunus trituberculatus]|uniref:Uncharacterized protein n=1 Tax=Portunus trituberculatus TaxID=210409 RepID=A0A5B7DMK1_PORTR|nr:hypothetical protein [Portunus trituberculatus]